MIRSLVRPLTASAAVACVLAAACAGLPGPSEVPRASAPDRSSAPSAPATAATLSFVPAAASAAEPATSSATTSPAPAPVPGFVQIPQDRAGKFPGARVAKARMVEVGNDCTRVVGEDGRLCSGAAEPGAELSAMQLERLGLLLADARAFTRNAPRCAAPTHAVVFYDDANLPVGYVSVSLACSALWTRPKLAGIPEHDGSYTLTSAGLAYVRGMCTQLKLSKCDVALMK